MAKGIASDLGAALLALILATPAGATSISVTWDMLSGGSPVTQQGKGFNNRLHFDAGGRRLTASGWYLSSRRGRFRGANVSQYAGGLGICQRRQDGRDCYRNAAPNPIDNAGEREWLLLSLDGEYSLQTLELLPATAGDLALSYWLGSVPAGTRLSGLGDGELAALGFGPRQDLTLAAGLPAVLDLSGALGNALLIGGDFRGSRDAFFVQRLTASEVVVPLPPSALAFGSALGLLCFVRLRGPGDRVDAA